MSVLLKHLTVESSIVAIHGLGGGWKTSWTDPATGTFWLRDLLPKDIPETRIISCGYEASKSSTTAMEVIAASLLADLVRLRMGLDTASERRPIVFLAHSFGGPLLKGALAMSHDAGSEVGIDSINASTYGILFFGVPEHAENSFDKLAAATSLQQWLCMMNLEPSKHR
ncbi:hypothetical protein MMC13_000073 [Lambiella insularis]|nr:hypothetical protein [Lambiella insularis]